ncbi:MAG TPA: hypothetical protein VFA05_05505 [Gaiellaceae bacterium]|nr:hypothetical protein [Gaiellaceae bacterium]
MIDEIVYVLSLVIGRNGLPPCVNSTTEPISTMHGALYSETVGAGRSAEHIV